MKNSSYAFNGLSLILMLGIVWSCNNNKEKKAVQPPPAPVSANHPLLVGPAEQDIIDNYLLLKDALVQSELESAQGYAEKLELVFNSQGLAKEVEITKRIASSRNLASVRKEFTVLSQRLITWIKGPILMRGKVFVQHCPMANNGDGGDWLSTEKAIRNPYYGDEMLECGAVLEEISIK